MHNKPRARRSERLAGDEAQVSRVASKSAPDEPVGRAPVRFFERGPPARYPLLIVENGAPDACIATVAAGERQIGEHLWNASVENGAIVATSLLAER
jgi:hypothetical protein